MQRSIDWYFSDMMRREGSIPIYQLYGEQGDAPSAGFGHIETIAERSALHDWEIAPHRHRHSAQILILSQGNVSAALDQSAAMLAAPCYLVVPAGTVHGFKFAPATKGYVLTVEQGFFARSRSTADPLTKLLAHGGFGPLPQPRLALLLADEMLGLEQQWQAGDGLFQPLAEALLRTLPAVPVHGQERDEQRLAQFRHLIETHLIEHRPVAFYAQAMGATERTLTRLCRKRLDCTPLEAINRRLTLEAQRLLRYTNATVAQVASELGFADTSYFSRFYLRMTGQRPTAERTQ